MIERRQAKESAERATDVAHPGHAPREPPTPSQAGLRTREWRILQGTAPSRASSRWYLPSFRLTYRCVGSAGMAFRGMLHRLPVSSRRSPKASAGHLRRENSTLRLLALQGEVVNHERTRCARTAAPAGLTSAPSAESTGNLTRVYHIAAPLPPYSSLYAAPYNASSRVARAEKPPR